MAHSLNDEEEQAMAIIGFSASQGIPGRVDIHAGITEEGDPSKEQWQEDEEPSTYSTPSTASTATASISTFNSCQCSKDLVELERQKVSLLKDVCGLLREAAKRDSKFLEEDINWKLN
ncbi:unnamed protein product [Arctogadus glacialis]